MKKLILVSLVLVLLLLPPSALALEAEIDYYCGYGCIQVAKDGSPYIAVIYFAEDHTCYYMVQLFRHGESGLGRVHVGFWGYNADGTIFAQTGDNTTSTFKITSLGSIVETSTLEVYNPFDGIMQ